MLNVFYLSAPIQLSVDNSATEQKFSGIAYSGDAIDGDVVIDLASTTVAENMPLLFAHDHEQIIGVINNSIKTNESISIDGLIFSDIDKRAQEITSKAKRGAQYQMSVGLYDSEVIESEDDNLELNGRTFTGKHLILKNGLVREVSIVALGADKNTNAKFFSLHNGVNMTNNKEEPVSKTLTEGVALRPIPELTAALEKAAVMESRALAAETEVVVLKKARRERIIMRVFKNFGKEITDINHYLELSDTAFNKIIEDLKGLKKSPDPALFSEVAKNGKSIAPEVTINPSQIFQARKIK